MFRGSVLAAFILALLAGVPAKATTYYVAKTGSDSAACTEVSPCLTIAHTYGKASSGDVVQVAAGSYSESLSLNRSGSAGNLITVQGFAVGDSCPVAAQSDVNTPNDGNRTSPVVTITGSVSISGSFQTFACFSVSGGISVSNSVQFVNVTDNAVVGRRGTGGTSPTYASPGVGIQVGNNPSSTSVYPSNINVLRNFITNTGFGIFHWCATCLFQDNEIYQMGTSDDMDYDRVWGNGVTWRHNYLHGTSNDFCDIRNGNTCHIDCWQTFNVNNGPGYVAKNFTMDGNVCLNSNESIIATNTTGSSGDLDNWTITNNVFAEGPLGNSPGGQTNAHIWCVDQDGQGSHFFIYFNTCDSGLFVSRASWRLSGATGSSQQLFNNIITNSGFQPYSAGSGSFDCPGGGCTVTADYNLLYDSSDSYSGWPSHTIVNQNPLYLNKAAHNYNIQVGSPAIDAALNENVLVDLIGHARPNGSGYDIGAYELASGTAANVNPPTNLSYTVH